MWSMYARAGEEKETPKEVFWDLNVLGILSW